MDLTWRTSTDLSMPGLNVQVGMHSALRQKCLHVVSQPSCCMQTASEEENQPRNLVTTERLIVKRASGRAIVNK